MNICISTLSSGVEQRFYTAKVGGSNPSACIHMIPKISILYEDEDVLVINKPAGLVVHSDGRTVEPTVVDWILAKYPETRGVGDSLPSALDAKRSTLNADVRPGIVHRLDRETSGALLIAKNQRAFNLIKKQFQRSMIRKVYHAFVYGSVKHDEGVIDRPIARSGSNSVLWSATRGRKGADRAAVTDYRVMTRTSEVSFLELRPRTGRTHQLRVHLKAINYPILCDKLYAPRRECLLGFKRLALHARSLSFILPSGKDLFIEAPYPKDFETALNALNKS